jgi:hypothetical protein
VDVVVAVFEIPVVPPLVRLFFPLGDWHLFPFPYL